MRVALNSNVFLVKGAVYDCIYDLNTQQLYRFNKDISSFLTAVCSEGIQNDAEPKKVQLLHYLIKEGVLRDCSVTPIAVQQKHEDGKIETAWLEITQLCNFRCIHCYEGQKTLRSMSYEDAMKSLGVLCKQEVKHLHIISGEPLLHPYIEKILEDCVDKFETFSIYTNASVITTRICELLKRLNATVYVSLNSDIEKDFEQVTCTRNMFKKVLEGIDILRRVGLNVIVKKVAMTGVSVSPKYEAFYGNFGGFPILVGNASLSQYTDEMLQKKIITEDSFRERLDVESVLINMHEHYCFRNRIYIDVNGDVYPCAMERRVKYGNISTLCLDDIRQSSLRKVTKDCVRECQDCEYRYACNTCYVDTLSEDFYAKPWFCSYQPGKGTWIPYDEFIRSLRER